MKKTIARLNTRIDLLEAEFKQNESRLTQLKGNRCSAEYFSLQERQKAINEEIHSLLEQLWSHNK